MAKRVLGIDYGSFLERMIVEYAIERKIIADRVETQERREPHKEEAPASYDVLRWALKRNLCVDLVMKEGYEKLSHLHPTLYTWHDIEVQARANGGPGPRQKLKNK